MSDDKPMTRPCPVCGKLMIKRHTGPILDSYPAYYPWDWWCACGHMEPGGSDRGLTDEGAARQEWDRANSEPEFTTHPCSVCGLTFTTGPAEIASSAPCGVLCSRCAFLWGVRDGRV